MNLDEIVDRLRDINEKMQNLLNESRGLIQMSGDEAAYAQAKSYWLAHIESALIEDHGYLGGSMITMEETINDLSGEW